MRQKWVTHINTSPLLLRISQRARDFRQTHRAVHSREYAEDWTNRLSALDLLLEAESEARANGHTDREIRMALKHPASKPA